MGVARDMVVKRYIDLLILLIPTPLVSALFGCVSTKRFSFLHKYKIALINK